MAPTYRALIRPIPPRLNLANAETKEASKTCQRCSALIPDRSRIQDGLIRTWYEYVDLYPEFPALKASARAGCDLCRLIRKTIRSAWAVRPMEEWGVGPLSEKNSHWEEMLASRWDGKVKIYDASFSVSHVYPESRAFTYNTAGQAAETMVIGLSMEFGPLTTPVAAGGQKHGSISQIINFKVFDKQDIESNVEDCERRLPSIDALSPANITLLSQWIRSCKSTHARCQVPSESLWIPTRLLDVGAKDGEELPRLIETSPSNVRGGYTALSHMWGGESNRPPLLTLMSNYDRMKDGIPISDLPKNFLQAMMITRKLGFRYVWIDSLCIIQDSSSDWKKEAVTMHEVYKYAEVTIVATSALSTRDGFLERSLQTIPAAKIQYSVDDLPDNQSYMILAAQDDRESGYWAGDIDGSTWNTRGWTLQERALSTRSIHFCKNKMYFECRDCRRSEENEPYTQYRLFTLWPRNESWMENLTPSPEETETERNIQLYKNWTRTVTNYTQRNLTVISDKLPAIQSTAAEMASSINDTYLPFAGMWEKHLQFDLLWQAKDGPTSRPDNFIAPTWSWASVNAKVHWNPIVVPLDSIHESLNKASFEVIYARQDEHTPSKCILFCKAFLQPLAFITEVDEDERSIYFTRVVLPVDLFIQAPSMESGDSWRTFPRYLKTRDRDLAIDQGWVVKFAEGRLDLDNKDRLTSTSDPLFYLHVDSSCSPSGLILRATEDVSAVGYHRVGVASVFTEDKRNLICSAPFENMTGVKEVTIA
ncbi:HET-domain-containing protein [Acephala macrosclerotiorum]|nr:HET-domain-containing protein [Acephala macrosclerotiorum]